MKSKEIKEFVESGYLRVNVLFEVVGNPKEHVEAMIKKVMEGVSSEKKIKVVSEEYGSAEDAGDGLWGTFCEADLLLKDVNVLSWLAFISSVAGMSPSFLTDMFVIWNEGQAVVVFCVLSEFIMKSSSSILHAPKSM